MSLRITEGLNPAQKEAVLYLQGPCLVLAGAGSGKTKVITQKIAYLLQEAAYSAANVFALTFTNKAAREMHERVAKQISAQQAKPLTICTFHALGVRFLREEGMCMGLKKSFTILDAKDVETRLQEILETTSKSLIEFVKHKISLWKNALISPEEAVRHCHNEDDETAAQAYRSYDKTLRSFQMVDFDDLIYLPVKILQTYPDVLKKWQSRVHYLLVDEYQDTNVCQYEWIKLLTAERQMFTLVGDDDQAIYAWRGATLENLAKLNLAYPDLKVIKLEQNYRSVDSILTAANNVIRDNPKLYPKTLWSTLGEGEPIVVHECATSEQEIRKVCDEIMRLKCSRHLKWSDFAILYRSNSQSRGFEEVLRSRSYPYSISGGQSFFEKTEIRDILAWLRLVANQDDDMAFVRAITSPKRGVGNQTLTTLSEFAQSRECSLFVASRYPEVMDLMGSAQYQALDRFCTYIEYLHGLTQDQQGVQTKDILTQTIKEIAYEPWLYSQYEEPQAKKRWQNVLDLVDSLGDKAQRDGLSLEQLLQYVALITMLERKQDDDDTQLDQIKLTTIHASKGLEYPYVFLVGCEEGYLPFFREQDDEDLDISEQEHSEEYAKRVQEERRLMYVAITRARYYLALSWARTRGGRRKQGNWQREPSRFIREMGLYPSEGARLKDEEHLPSSERLSSFLDMLA